jgi:hypothetical protein
MNYSTCVKKYIALMPSLPPRWAEMIACNICNIVCNPISTCEDIRNCQTLTELTNFDVDGRRVCFSYDDERGVRLTRCFTLPITIDGIDDTEGSCLTEEWGDLTSTEKWQAVVDKICNCCQPATTTSTTTTTTQACVCGTYSAYNAGGTTKNVFFVTCANTVGSVSIKWGNTIQFCACYSGDPMTAILYSGGADITFLGDTCFTTTTTAAPTTTTTSTTTIQEESTTTTTTTSTTTTTTANPCVCISYLIENISVSPISGSYSSCVPPYDTIGFLIGVGGSLQICACEGQVDVPDGIDVTDQGLCAEFTTTTTTTTTTTAAPTTTTTSTTTIQEESTTSTTTTTTEDPDFICSSWWVQGDEFGISMEWEECETGNPQSATIFSGGQFICAIVGTLTQTGGNGTVSPGGVC